MTAPVAVCAADPETGLAPLVVAFSSAGSSGTSYAWDFGDGATSAVANPSHTYAARGVYTVVLTVTNISGSDTCSVEVTVSTPSRFWLWEGHA